MDWLVEVWSALSSQNIANGFRKFGLLPSSIKSSSAVDDADGIADVVVDNGILDALFARRSVDPGRVRVEDDIEWTSDSDEIQQSQWTFFIEERTQTK